VLSHSKMQAQQTSCLNNLKQITTAGLMYLNETQKGLPYNTPLDLGYDPSVPPGWVQVVTNYGANTQVLFCPSTRSQVASLGALVPGAADLGWSSANDNVPNSASYGFNAWLTDFITIPVVQLGGNGSDALVYPRYMFSKLSSIQKPSQTPLFFDENYFGVVPLETDSAASDLYWGQDPIAYGRDGMGCCTILRHGGRTANASVPYTQGQHLPGAINIGLADGHVELSKLQNLWNYSWHLNWTNPPPKP
jgi:prepilin-type processing-associated H-X9-DG protein